ncbi:polyprenyl synthetase family protein [Herbidospora sp. NBRC 101105]|uniref:polyprenyl synthetase family protein n=1 Tax=Herbidospora sp. NBRC 101105 TaxID=3032195 RepID=UPI0024A301CB|nr:polyprenyl synthetase family protein [Herbidospora sp. NBRC 101105]GLX96351.1 dimethylallyltransferase [Herbidospora sp. NBRC 101105]
MTDSMGVADLLNATRELIEPAHRAAIDRLSPELRHVAGYHIGWWDERGRPRRGGQGRFVRPALALGCARAAGGHAHDAVPMAVATELVNDFSLLHDDVIDGDAVRRERPAAWTVFGLSEALLTGDALLAVAMALVGPAGVRTLADALLDLCHGQASDLAFVTRPEVSLAECMTMAENKTGALLGAACELGALAGGAREVHVFREFGTRLGLAFRLTDDLRSLTADLACRRKSLPVVAALNSGTQVAVLLAESLNGEPDPAAEADLVEQTGAREWALREADRQVELAFAALGHGATPELRLLADLSVGRGR